MRPKPAAWNSPPAHTLPLQGPQLRAGISPLTSWACRGLSMMRYLTVWGMLLMDRLFRRRVSSRHASAPGATGYIGSNAMGAMSFSPSRPRASFHSSTSRSTSSPLRCRSAAGVRMANFCSGCCRWAAHPKAPAPKALIYRDPHTGTFTTAATPGFDAWLIKFPARMNTPRCAPSKWSMPNVCGCAASRLLTLNISRCPTGWQPCQQTL